MTQTLHLSREDSVMDDPPEDKSWYQNFLKIDQFPLLPAVAVTGLRALVIHDGPTFQVIFNEYSHSWCLGLFTGKDSTD